MASIDDLWPGNRNQMLMPAVTMLYRSARQGYETDISAFAAAMNIPRTSAHRLLNQWEKLDYVALERKGRKTLIRLTLATLDRLEKFFDDNADVFCPATD